MEDNLENVPKEDPLNHIGFDSTKLKNEFMYPGLTPYVEHFIRMNLYQNPIDYFSTTYDAKRIGPSAHLQFFDQNSEVFPKLLSDQDPLKRSIGLQYIARFCHLSNPKGDEQLKKMKATGLKFAEQNIVQISRLATENSNEGQIVQGDPIAIQILGSLLTDENEHTSYKAKHIFEQFIDQPKNPSVDFGLVSALLKTPNLPHDLNKNTREVIKKVFTKYNIDGAKILNSLIDYKLDSPRSAWEKDMNEDQLVYLFLSDQIDKMGELEATDPGVLAFLVNVEHVRHFDNTESPQFQLFLFKHDAYKKYPDNYLHSKDLKKQTFIDSINNYGLNGEYLYKIYTKYPQIPEDKQRETLTSTEAEEAAVRRELEAIKVLEDEEPGVSEKLWSDFGIRFFSRYPSGMLLSQFIKMDDVDDIKAPYGMVLFPESDWNGGFDGYQNMFALFNLQIGYDFNLIVIEAATKTEAVRRINQLRKKYGLISFALIGGHGSEGSIRLGDDKVNGIIQLEDFLRPGASALNLAFVDSPTLILASCSTGKKDGIAQQMSNNATIIAPDNDTRLTKISMRMEDGRPSFSVTYREAQAVNYTNKQLVPEID